MGACRSRHRASFRARPFGLVAGPPGVAFGEGSAGNALQRATPVRTGAKHHPVLFDIIQYIENQFLDKIKNE
jgi:hypothetical protein